MFEDEGELGPLDADLWMARLQVELDLPSLAEAAGVACRGVSRFFDCGDDAPDQVVTCLWQSSLVMVEVVTGWSNLPREQREGRLQTSRWVGRVPHFLLPGALRGWEQLRESLASAPSCRRTAVLGRTLCCHGLLADGTISSLVWINPHPRRDRPQAQLIAAYRWLARISRLCSLLPVQGKNTERSPSAAGSLAWTGSPL